MDLIVVQTCAPFISLFNQVNLQVGVVKILLVELHFFVTALVQWSSVLGLFTSKFHQENEWALAVDKLIIFDANVHVSVFSLAKEVSEPSCIT